MQRTATNASAHCSSQPKCLQASPLPARPACAGLLGCSSRVPAGCYGLRRGVQQTVRRRSMAVVRAEYGDETHWGVPEDSYLVLGLAHCFQKTEEGRLSDCFVIEPISASALECMTAGAKTCFLEVTSVRLGQALQRSLADLPAMWTEKGAVWCDDYDFRVGACARTWLRPHAQDNLMDIVPLGQTKGKWNYNLDEKRVLNFENVVNDDDNIKQDLSIDVYGRKTEEDAPEDGQADAEPAAPAEEEADELDALLSR